MMMQGLVILVIPKGKVGSVDKPTDLTTVLLLLEIAISLERADLLYNATQNHNQPRTVQWLRDIKLESGNHTYVRSNDKI